VLKATITRDEITPWLDRLEAAAAKVPQVAMERLRVRGEEHFLRLVNALIYDTPERGGYSRTGRLKRGIKAHVVREGGQARLYLVNTQPAYPGYVEVGTYDNRLTIEEVLAMAEGVPDELILLDVPREGKGMEARPTLYPTWVYLARTMPEVVMDALFELVENA
jgi:hypothetical protein